MTTGAPNASRESCSRELARLLREEVTDPRVGLVTLTRIDVAPDLTHALVFWSALDVERRGSRRRSIRPASTARRRSCAAGSRARCRCKRSPELRFRYDPSLALGTRTLSVAARDRADRARPTERGGDGAER